VVLLPFIYCSHKCSELSCKHPEQNCWAYKIIILSTSNVGLGSFFGGICLRESPRPYAHYINWSICGYSIKFADLYIICILKFGMMSMLYGYK